MNMNDLRSSQSSYGDPRYLSQASFGAPPPPPAKALINGYRDDLDSQDGGKGRYNPLNAAHPRSSALLNANDPVTMYLLTETAMGDSVNYEILSLEEVEELKKEYTFLSGRVESTRRKLALETKLRDAAKSLNRLYTPQSPRTSEEFDGAGSPKSRRSSRRSLFGHNKNNGTADKTDEELAVSVRKCEDLSLELWKLERRVQNIQRRLLEHTAGVLQMTHKGLKKNPKSNGLEYEDNVNGNGHTHEFDDRSLYKTTDHFDEFGGLGKGGLDHHNGSGSMAVGVEAIQNTERKLEALSERMRDMILQANPDDEFEPIPQPSTNGGPINPTATVEAYLAYIENGMGMLRSNPIANPTSASREIESDEGTTQHVGEVNARLHYIVGQSGLSRGPTLPPPPDSSKSGLQEQLSYLTAGVDGLQSRVEGLLEQKSILTTQIQQQRELNSKSDAERDAHIADLVEQLAHARKQFELSEREGQSSRDELSLVMEQLDAVRQELAHHQQEASTETTRNIGKDDDAEALASEKESRARAEAEVARLGAAMEKLQLEINGHAESHEHRERAEAEVLRLEAAIQQLHTEKEGHSEIHEARVRAESEVSRLEAAMAQLQAEVAGHAEVHEARTRADAEVTRLEATVQQLQAEIDGHAGSREHRERAEAEVLRLEAAVQQLHAEKEGHAEVLEARERAENEVKRLQSHIEELRSGTDKHSDEVAAARAEANSEIARLQSVIDQLNGDANARAEEVTETQERTEQQISQLEETINQIRIESDTRVKEAADVRAHSEGEVSRLEAAMEQLRIDVEAQVKEATEGRAQAEENAARLQAELTEIEGEVVRVSTELTMARAELDGAYGSRSQRAAVASNPAIQRELDALNTRNIELAEELAALKARKPGNNDLQHRAQTLEKELRETIDDYESMTKSSIEFEKEREGFEVIIDGLRDRCEQLETQINEERINWMGLHSPTSMGRDGTTSETTSTMVLKNEFKKMMRDTRMENMKILKAEHEERRRLENLIRNMKREQANNAPNGTSNQGVTAL
ncbi:hypothetical protein ASPWEDRAFT_47389 [Aspergillus wentii DTO 134E9]|uniref:Uncharacterized protein n=1 Tax=Aspergillus wentii DTO 134E9 TaxID=1073089 RepID=A0A1L9S087_ASPWE|nr:uncharacterized protein ASPWEDRAFT_47389 [Aspergillus wentii DTO 134E9]KAI9933011.1 hypothetical protein MW887_009265 [Aspergillus wentii]OJJ40595.1 hypothetical protein ASPWEDRAFT_47389 [Aspergillus wentii DTO 134E9]